MPIFSLSQYDQIITGSILATSFTGSLQGTASFATSGSFAISASYATSAGSAISATSASYASTASYVNPLSQDVSITGDLTITGPVIGNVGALTIASSTASMDCSTANFFTLTLGNGVDTHLDATNIQTGQTINVKLTNNATAAGTISFAPEFEFVDGTAFEVTAATSAVDIMTFISFDGTSLQGTGLKNFS